MQPVARSFLALSLCLLVSACGDDATGASTDASDTNDTSSSGTTTSDDETTTTDDTTTGGGETTTTTTGGVEDFPPADEPGPYGVGFRTIDVTYTPEGFDEERTINVSIWYPTDDASGDPTVYFDLITRDDVYLDATPVGGLHPVFAFSHGNGGIAEQSFFLTEYFASHGWIVVAPDHTGNTLTDIDAALIPDMVVLRPLDITAMLDEVYDLPASDPLAGLLDDVLVASGHSFGGYTTLALAGGNFDVDSIIDECEIDPMGLVCASLTPERITQLKAGFADARVDLALPLTPGAIAIFGDQGLSAIEVPTMLMTSLLDETTPNDQDGDPAWSGLADPRDLRVEFLTGGHYTFTFACEAGLIEGDGCGDDFIAPAEAFDVINTYALAFVRDRLWGDPSVQSILDGSEPLSDVVTLVAH